MKKLIKIFFFSLIGLHIIFFLVLGVFIIRYRTRNPEETALMRSRSAASSENMETPIEPDLVFVPLDRIPAHIVRTILYIEDFNFFVLLVWEGIVKLVSQSRERKTQENKKYGKSGFMKLKYFHGQDKK